MSRDTQHYWYVFEAIGTVRQLTDSQSQIPDTYFYDSWGNELTSSHSQIPNPFRYVGKHGYYLDTQSALMLLGVRYYASGNGLFLSRDLIEGYGYTYAADNPARWIDPRGLQHDSEHCNIVNGQRECAPSRGGKDGVSRGIPPFYGNYCGPQTGYPPGREPPPIDELDACCKKHDEDYARNKFTALGHLKCRAICPIICLPLPTRCIGYAIVDNALCHCAKKAKCQDKPFARKVECEVAKKLIIQEMCYPCPVPDGRKLVWGGVDV